MVSFGRSGNVDRPIAPVSVAAWSPFTPTATPQVGHLAARSQGAPVPKLPGTSDGFQFHFLCLHVACGLGTLRAKTGTTWPSRREDRAEKRFPHLSYCQSSCAELSPRFFRERNRDPRPPTPLGGFQETFCPAHWLCPASPGAGSLQTRSSGSWEGGSVLCSLPS